MNDTKNTLNGNTSVLVSKGDLMKLKEMHVAHQYNSGVYSSFKSFFSMIVNGMYLHYENDKSLINQSMTIDLRPQNTSIAS